MRTFYFLSFILVFALSSCGDDDDSGSDDTLTTQTITSTKTVVFNNPKLTTLQNAQINATSKIRNMELTSKQWNGKTKSSFDSYDDSKKFITQINNATNKQAIKKILADATKKEVEHVRRNAIFNLFADNQFKKLNIEDRNEFVDKINELDPANSTKENIKDIFKQAEDLNREIRFFTTFSANYKKGEFKNYRIYRNQCNNDNSDIDFIKEKKLLTEKLWLRSWIHENYLWTDDVYDVDPSKNKFDFNFKDVDGNEVKYNDLDPKIGLTSSWHSPNIYTTHNYFKILQSPIVMRNGKLKDQFHFAVTEDKYDNYYNGEKSYDFSYGINWQIDSAGNYVIGYVEPNSPASSESLKRGDVLTKIDGKKPTKIDSLDELIYPKTSELHNFTFRTRKTNTEVNKTLIPEIIDTYPVAQNSNIITTANHKKLAYLQFNSFVAQAQDELIEKINEFKQQGVTDVVLDLRYNGGGLVSLASQLSYMLAGKEKTKGKYFEKMIFNKYRKNQLQEFLKNKINYDTGQEGEPLPTLPNLDTVYILTNKQTCSSSESIINNLRGIGQNVIQIGDTTCGKPYGFTPTLNCGWYYHAIEFEAKNYAGFGDFTEGLVPTANPKPNSAQVHGCMVKDDFDHDLGNKNERLLAEAIHYAEKGSCKTSQKPVTKAISSNFLRNFKTKPIPQLPQHDAWKNNKIYIKY